MIRALYLSKREDPEGLASAFDGSSDLKIYASSSLDDAMEIIDFERYDAIVIDQDDNNGVVRPIDEARMSFPFVPLIIVTREDSGDEEIGRLKAAGADYCLHCEGLPGKEELSSAISGAIRNSSEREREARDDAIEVAGLGIWTMDSEAGEMCLDDTGKFHLGIENAADTISLDILKDVLDPDAYKLFIKQYYKLMNKQLPLFEIKCSIPAGGGGFRYVRMKGAVSEIDCDGEPVAVVGTTQDITECFAEKLQLLNTIDNLKLLAKISRHDIINQVTALDSIFVLIETELPKKDHVERAFGMVHEITENIKRQIVFSRIYHNLRSYDPEWINLKEAVLMSGVNLLPNKAVLNADLENIMVYADPMFEKVFYNLFENSVRHGKHVSEITVTTKEDADGSLLITVIDNGIGIPEESKKEIFTSGVGSNTGLGLFLVSEILDITGITINEKGRYGEGAEFEIRVPAGGWKLPESE